MPGREDVWIPSACSMCYSNCGIVAHRVDGTVVKIEGNPNNPVSGGRICAKGLSSIMTLYDPNRVNYPLRRTNPEKGIGIDPKWERISWDEAIGEVARRLKALRDQGKAHTLVFMSGRNRGQSGGLIDRFVAAYGSPNHVGHSSICADGTALLCGRYVRDFSRWPRR